jgi:outer membrane murein-binding lipoprotein Lpp
MKTTIKSLGAVILGGGLLISGCAKKQTVLFQSLKMPEVAAQLKTFVAEKELEARAGTNDVSVFQAFFAATEKGDWLAISNTYNDLKSHAPQYNHAQSANDERLNGPCWQMAKEIWGAFDAFGEGDEKYSTMFGNDIIESIPPGSIYFGGTDPGRFIVTALQKSHATGDPFFTLTQNALVDSTYLAYLRGLYGAKIYTPTDDDSRTCFQNYMKDVQKRLQNQQLKPGENIQTDANGRITVSGQVAVMEINGLLVKIIFDKNTNCQLYIEESFPFDWMYPYLEPHGLIMKINRQPLASLSEDVVSKDHDYWAKYVTPMIGGWLTDDTSVGEIAAFAKKTFGKKDFTGFTGDPRFIQNAYSHQMFSKLRSSIAGLYAWRLKQAADASEKERMAREADFAFRQAWALCPYSPEAVFRYVNFLLAQNRAADALVVAETAAQMPSMQGKDGEQLRNLVEQLKKFQKAK